MNGTAHATVGGVVGGIVGLSVGVEPVSVDMGMLVGLGAVAGLVPDLDTDGILRKLITISPKFLKWFASIIGILIILHNGFQVDGIQRIVGVLFGLGVIFLAFKFITKKRMQSVTGALVIASGIGLGTLWIILLGVYILVASFLPHRSYTHSLIGLVFFGYIAHLISLDFNNVEGLFYTLIGGYISHLALDTKFILTNSKGVKWFQPFLKMEL